MKIKKAKCPLVFLLYFFLIDSFIHQALLVIPNMEEHNLTDIETFYYKEFLMNSIESVKRMNETVKLQEICHETTNNKRNIQSLFKV